MITNYEIKEIGQETVIALYLDFSLEIGSFDSKEKESFLSTVKKYIKKLDIKEQCQKILLMSGSIVVATLACINDDIHWLSTLSNSTKNVNVNIFFNTDIPSVSYFEKPALIVPKIEEEIKEEKADVIEREAEDENESIGQGNSERLESFYLPNMLPQTTSELKEEKVKQEGTANEDTMKEESISKKIEQTKVEENELNLAESEIQKQMVTVYRSNGIILEIELEEYIVGVVAAEIPASFSSEALKAQSVVARTYALRKIFRGERLTDTISTQAYIDMDQMKSKWESEFEKYYNKIKKAVSATEGEFITYQGNYINAVYHSTSNGYTEDAVNVWKESYPYLKSVDSNWDKDVNSYKRTITREFHNLLDITGLNDENLEIKILSRNLSGRVETIQVGEKIYTGVEFRNLLGLRSTDFDIKITDGNIEITTRGYGHGVGMSQYGANEMAKAGYNYRQIINHYYTGVQIQK